MEYNLDKALSLTENHKIIEFVSHTLKKPVILEDDQFNLLSYSSYYIHDFDQANQQTILSKKSPLPILEKFREDGIIDKLKSVAKPFRVKRMEEIGLNQRIVVSIKNKHDILGYLWVQEIDNPLSEKEIDFIDQVSFHIGKILYNKNQARREKDEKKVQFYRQLLKNAAKSEKLLQLEAQNLCIRIPTLLNVIVFKMKRMDDELLEHLKEMVQSYIHVSDCRTELLIDSYTIIVIIGDSSPSRKMKLAELGKELVTRIIKSFEQRHSETLFAGIGNTYEQLSQLRESYLEALEVIKSAEFIGSQENMQYEYGKLGIYRYITVLAELNKDIQYVNPELLKLKQKDNENQSELLKTLEIYLMNNCKSKPTVERLFIHPNTLNYRLKQILEYTNINLSDFNMNFQLFIDLLIMKSKE